jgi:hypothetical protein
VGDGYGSGCGSWGPALFNLNCYTL